jgi:hypothetical protein
MNTFVKTTDPNSMTIFPIHIHGYEINGVRGFDFIRIIFRDTGPGVGSMVVHTDQGTYSSHWNAMGKSTVEEFVREVSADYLTRDLTLPRFGSKPPSKQENARLYRMVETIQEGLKSIAQRQ